MVDDVGNDLCDKSKWVNKDDPYYLVTDNAGGHGTNECVSQYTNMLLPEFNIVIIHQVLRPPFTNVLDLGVTSCSYM